MCPLLPEESVFSGLKQQRDLSIKSENTALMRCSSTHSPLTIWVWERLLLADLQAFACHGDQSLRMNTTLGSATWEDAAELAPEMDASLHKKRRCLMPSSGGVRSQSCARSWPLLYKSMARLCSNPTSDKTCLARCSHRPIAWVRSACSLLAEGLRRCPALGGAADPLTRFLSLSKAGWPRRPFWASTYVLRVMGYGGMGFCGRKGAG